MVLVALTLYNFITLLTDFMLQGRDQMRSLVDGTIWIVFVTLLYWALKNRPSISGPVVGKKEDVKT